MSRSKGSSRNKWVEYLVDPDSKHSMELAQALAGNRMRFILTVAAVAGAGLFTLLLVASVLLGSLDAAAGQSLTLRFLWPLYIACMFVGLCAIYLPARYLFAIRRLGQHIGGLELGTEQRLPDSAGSA